MPYRYKVVSEYRVLNKHGHYTSRYFSTNMRLMANARHEEIDKYLSYDFIHEYSEGAEMTHRLGFMVFRQLLRAKEFARLSIGISYGSIFRCRVSGPMLLPLIAWPLADNLDGVQDFINSQKIHPDKIRYDPLRNNHVNLINMPKGTERWETIKLISEI